MSKNGKQAGSKPAAVASVVAKEAADARDVVAAVVRAAFKSDGHGGGTLQLRYTGELAGFDTVWVRLGERRHGADWLDVRDVRMERSDGQAIAKIQLQPGEPVEGASFAFFATQKDQADPTWDNAGHPFGCYVLDAQSGAVRSR
ncbi:MAG: hypothetical protein QM765_23990 [Myxococcales bacterium]